MDTTNTTTDPRHLITDARRSVGYSLPDGTEVNLHVDGGDEPLLTMTFARNGGIETATLLGYVVTTVHEGSDFAVRRATLAELKDEGEEILDYETAVEHAKKCARRDGCRWYDFSGDPAPADESDHAIGCAIGCAQNPAHQGSCFDAENPAPGHTPATDNGERVILTMRFDITGLTSQQVEAFAGALLAQAEGADDEGEDACGYPEVQYLEEVITLRPACDCGRDIPGDEGRHTFDDHWEDCATRSQK